MPVISISSWLSTISFVLFVGSIVYHLCFGAWRQGKEPDAADLSQEPLNESDRKILDNCKPGAAASPPAQIPDNSAAAYAQADVPQGQDGFHPEATGKIAIKETMPVELAAIAHSSEHAIPLVLALLFDDKPDARGKQEACVRQFLGEPALVAANALMPQIAQLVPMLRLPAAELALPVLRKRSRPELTSLTACVDAMAQADGETGLFEYCVGCMLRRQLIHSLDPSADWRAGRKKLLDVLHEIALLLSLIAQNGIVQNDEGSAAAAESAYTAGMHSILPDASIAYAPPVEGVVALDKVWAALDGLDGIGKTLLIEGVVATIGPVEKMTVAQSELLRTVCAVLDCALPPMLDHA